LNADKRKVLDQLIVKGFVVAADQESPAKYKLTGKAQQLLAERGVGLSGGQQDRTPFGVRACEAPVDRATVRVVVVVEIADRLPVGT
jgi:hypothetical protein